MDPTEIREARCLPLEESVEAKALAPEVPLPPDILYFALITILKQDLGMNY